MSPKLEEPPRACNLKYAGDRFLISTVRLERDDADESDRHWTQDSVWYETASGCPEGIFTVIERYETFEKAVAGHKKNVEAEKYRDAERRKNKERHALRLKTDLGGVFLLTEEINELSIDQEGGRFATYIVVRKHKHIEELYWTAKEAILGHERHVAKYEERARETYNLFAQPEENCAPTDLKLSLRGCGKTP